MSDKKDESLHSARVVQDVAGLTNRQMNDWDGRGALPHQRDGNEGWRRYTLCEVFVIAVCATIRRQYGTPVHKLKYIQKFMLQDGANHLYAAASLMDMLGVGIWLLTDLEETFIMDSELELANLAQDGFFHADSKRSLILVPIDPIVKRILANLPDPIHLNAHGLGHQIMSDIRKHQQVRTPEEQYVLNAIRNDTLARVEVKLANGQIKTVHTTSNQDATSDLEDLLDEPYQTLTVTKKDGKIVHIQQEITHKPGKEGSQ